MIKKEKMLERFYFLFLFLLYLLIILTPYIIRSGISFFEEEYLEAIIISILIMIGYYVLVLYRREVNKNLKALKELEEKNKTLEDRLMESFKYIGSVNVQIQEIRSAFSNLDKYPENKKDYKYILQFFSEKILGIVDVDWALLRIINTTNNNILREYSKIRGKSMLLKCAFSNEELIDGKVEGNYSVIRSTQENFTVKTICVFPKKKISNEQTIIIKAIVNQLEMLFLIFASNYYKNSRFLHE